MEGSLFDHPAGKLQHTHIINYSYLLRLFELEYQVRDCRALFINKTTLLILFPFLISIFKVVYYLYFNHNNTMNSVWEALKKGAGAVVGGGQPTATTPSTAVPLTVMLPTTSDEESGISTPYKVSKVASLHGHTDRVWGVSWHPSGNYFVTCGGDRTARLYSRVRRVITTSEEEGANDGMGAYPYTWECIHTLEGEHQRTVRSASWTSDGRRLALSSFDATLSVWLFRPENTDEPMELESIIDGHENEVKGCAWCPAATLSNPASASSRGGSDLLATCSRDRTAWVWEANRQGSAEDEDAEYECAGVLNGHSQDVKHVCWVPQDRSLITASYDETMKHWRELRKDDWQCVQTMTAHSGTVWCAAAQPLASITLPSTTAAAAAGAEEDDVPAKTSYLPDTAPLVCSCSDDGTMKVWCQLERPAEGVVTDSETSDAAGIDDGAYRRTKLAMVGSTGAEGFTNGRSAYCVAWCPPYSHPVPAGESGTLLTSDIVVVATGDDSLCFFKLARKHSTDNTAPTSADEAATLISVNPIAACSAAHEGEVNCVAFAPTPLQHLPTDATTAPQPLQFEVVSVGDDNAAHVWLLTNTPSSR